MSRRGSSEGQLVSLRRDNSRLHALTATGELTSIAINIYDYVNYCVFNASILERPLFE